MPGSHVVIRLDTCKGGGGKLSKDAQLDAALLAAANSKADQNGTKVGWFVTWQLELV